MSFASKTSPSLIDGSGRRGSCLTSHREFNLGGSNRATELCKSFANNSGALDHWDIGAYETRQTGPFVPFC